MSQIVADKRDVDFVLYEVMECLDITKYEKHSGFDRKSFNMVVSEARRFGIKEILPTYSEGDCAGATFCNGEVTVPECYKRPFQLYCGEWTSMSEDPDLGGQGLPHIVAQAASEYLSGANISLTTYAVQGHGVGKMIQMFGTDKQKELFLKKLYTAHWTGAMLLTESNAGSDVGALTTSAIKNDDGTYSLTGNKIFISVGEHNLTDNIIHAVLARVEGAPEGTRGLSLFIVPKFWVNDDGSIGDRNDILCTGIEQKMGIHGMVTCAFALGSKGTCRGMLLGEENKGMKVMFNMMNEERLIVGAQAFGNASSAYLYALNYSRERIQGRDLKKVKDAKASDVAIINHPDVRRMLLSMKAYVEGMRCFIYYVAYCFDQVDCLEADEEKTAYDDLISFFTPLIKAYCSDRSFQVCADAMQVYGGYGYIRDYPIEQLLRDVKVVSLYEGTNGIQAMDLLGRKIGMKNGAVFHRVMNDVKQAISRAEEIDRLKSSAKEVALAAEQIEKIASELLEVIDQGNIKLAYSFAVPFLEVMGDFIMAWMWLWRANVAASKISDKLREKDLAFYEGQILTAEFFIHSILPVTMGKLNAIKKQNNAVLTISELSFGS